MELYYHLTVLMSLLKSLSGTHSTTYSDPYQRCGHLQFENSTVWTRNRARLFYYPTRTDPTDFRYWSFRQKTEDKMLNLYDSKMPQYSDKERYSEMREGNRYVLTIKNTAMNDSGEYVLYCTKSYYSVAAELDVLSVTSVTTGEHTSTSGHSKQTRSPKKNNTKMNENIPGPMNPTETTVGPMIDANESNSNLNGQRTDIGPVMWTYLIIGFSSAIAGFTTLFLIYWSVKRFLRMQKENRTDSEVNEDGQYESLQLSALEQPIYTSMMPQSGTTEKNFTDSSYIHPTYI